jgi:hypothetical protein
MFDLKIFATIAHLIGVAIGVGAATVSDVLFFKFLKDLRISKQEAGVLKALHPLFWIALFVLILSGIMLYAQDPEHFRSSAKFQLKVVVVCVIVLNGLLLHFVVSPKLQQISFGKPHKGHHAGELKHLRLIAFGSGAVSLVSWYSALVLGALRGIPVTFFVGVALYLVVIFGAIGVSILVARGLDHRR